MRYQIISENEWLYPDSVITEENNSAVLYSARNADVCFQVLTDIEVPGGTACKIQAEGLGCEVAAYQLMPAHVGQNSDEKRGTTLDYESVKHFVTRQAPYDVYDITRPIEDGTLVAGRAVFFIRLNVEKDAVPGQYEGAVNITVGEEELVLPVSLKVYRAQIPALKDAQFHMANWLYPTAIEKMHHVEIMSEKYKEIYRKYLENQIDMRNDILMIPAGVPVRDEAGKVVDFDFSHAIFAGNLALKLGFENVMGGFPATWVRWDEAGLKLTWDEQVDITSLEGYRQLKLYFTRAWEVLQENNWQGHYMQCLVDEPQFATAMDYRALSAICRRFMPGIKINDPVETTEIEGALDIWVVKQAIYEKYMEKYRALQDIGEEIWLYSCGFPAGYMMNRVIDLPLVVSRLFMWVCYRYQCPGFLHWGYASHNWDVEKETCYRRTKDTLPPGDSFIVYPSRDDKDEVWYSIRGHHQRLGAFDYELFHMLGVKYSFEKVDELITRCCRGFEDYKTDVKLAEEIRHEVLELLG